MKCVIVGANGFIGRHLGRRCAQEGDSALGFDADDTQRGPAGFPILKCNVVTDRLDLPRDADVVYYLAQSARAGTFPKGAGDLFSVNVAGAVRAAESAHAAGVKLFCYASTGTVYQPTFNPMAEEHPVQRDDPYALSKVAAEEALALLPGPMQIVCVRPFGVFGAGQKPTMLVPSIARRVLDGRPVCLHPNSQDPSDVDGLRISLSFVEDVAWCLHRIARLAVAGKTLPSPLNVAGAQAVSLRTLAEHLGRLAGVEPRFEVSNTPRSSDFVADIDRLRALVSPEFTPLPDALATVIPTRIAS